MKPGKKISLAAPIATIGIAKNDKTHTVFDSAPKSVNETEHIIQSLKMLITTRPGTRPLLPDYGCRIHELLFKPVTPSLIARMQFFIEQSIKKWEPRVSLDYIQVTQDDGSLGKLTLKITWSLEGNDKHLLEIPITDGQVLLASD